MESIRLYRAEEAEALFHVWQEGQKVDDAEMQKRINAKIRARKAQARQRQRETRLYFLKQKAVAVGGILTGLFLAAIEPVGLLACVPFIGLFFTNKKVLVE